ncbi:hypothetical protein N7481_004072 [Penicillium waksmanii]|uniref:uncharacterized protein n=1 Tax=Penicillium waksmanii TaxID=69791 RepID=UPI0025485F7B|nr:uncharacterized protein N7481_004072 [Penicillium waksmanii]KAJ5988862.1 hypothetical protein N7481_004072 [Penicillium waksmanii]
MSDSGPAGSSDKASTDNPQASNVRWQFIDSSNNRRSNLTQVKRHVMQEYMRQKKGDSQQGEDEEEEENAPIRPAKRGRPKSNRAAKRKSTRKATHFTPQDPQSTNATNQPPAVSKQDALADIEDSGQDRIVAVTTSSNRSKLPAQAQSITHLPYRTSSIQPYNPFEPQRLMNISPQPHNPFNTLPVELDLDGQRLFDFYVNDMPACSYGTHFRSLKAHNWYTAVFVPEAMKGAVAFQNTILVHAANTWAWVRNEGETADGLLHRDRAIRMLREHMHKNPGDTSDVAIISCLSAAALEDFDPRPGRKEFSWMHMRAARDMIRARGGPAAFANTRLGMLINWQDYILSGYETRGLSFSFEPTPSFTPNVSAEPLVQPSQISQSMPSPPYSTSSLSDVAPCSEPTSAAATSSLIQLSPIDEIRLQCEEFLDFLRRCEQLALYQKANPELCDLSRHTSVQESSLLFQILAAPPGARFTASGDRKQMVARFTALMILNAALWDYRYAPIHEGTFLRTLEYALIDSEVSMSGSVEAILQILLTCNDGYVSVDDIVSSSLSDEMPDFTQYSSVTSSPSARPWFAGRMLKIAKRLSADSWHQISDLFFSCLTLQVSEHTVHSWEPELRREILEAPLTSYSMPSLLE